MDNVGKVAQHNVEANEGDIKDEELDLSSNTQHDETKTEARYFERIRVKPSRFTIITLTRAYNG